jgi:hypothetical protein
MHCDHAQHRGQYVHVLIFLSWCGILTVFDFVFLIAGSFFKVVRVRSIYCCCWASVSCNCYLLGWGNMCEIIAIWRRILELIRGSSSSVGWVLFLHSWGVVRWCSKNSFCSCVSLLSAASSYIDDTAHTEN